MEQQAEIISLGEALNRLEDGDMVHTFMNPGPGMLVGADWKRQDVLDALRKAERIVVTRGVARGMDHGMVIEHDGEPLFIATKRESKA